MTQPSPNLPPTGAGTASIAASTVPPPKKPRRRFRNFLLSLFILTGLGYAGGVYYSLVNDNFHDFFTEYIPYGEEAVGYFEEREYRRRFPTREYSAKNYPQIRGEQKVTIGKQSGLQPRVAEGGNSGNGGADLAQKGRHVSAVEDNKVKEQAADQDKHKPAAPGSVQQAKKAAETEKPNLESKKSHELVPKQESKPAPPAPEKKPATPAPEPKPTIAAPTVDHLKVPEAEEPVVQDLVKLVNNIITTINASPDASKYTSTLSTAKDELSKVISGITTLKDKATHDAETTIKNAHTEFDSAAKELVRRLEGEMQEQEVKWREEYENEREKLSQTYQQRLSVELDAAKKVADQKRQNELLEQEIQLQRHFMDQVRSSVESERSGRLAKLDELSTSVSELEKLTGEWNSVVDSTLATQHLHVALEAVRAKLQEAEEVGPTPFLNELVALKEVSREDEVVDAVIASIPPVAYQRGLPSAAHLIDRFRRVASEVRKASLLPEDAGIASHAASAVLSRLMFTKKSDRGLPEGDDVEATLARTEVLLEEGDLDGAAREMNGLKGWAGVLSRDWIAEARRVVEVRMAVDVSCFPSTLSFLDCFGKCGRLGLKCAC